MTSTVKQDVKVPVAVAMQNQPRSVKIGYVAAIIGAVIGICAVVPILLPVSYMNSVAVNGAIFAILVVSVGFLNRHLGLISLGHAAIFGGSAYFVAISVNSWGFSPAGAVLAGLLGGTAIAAVLGALVNRMVGIGFLTLTLALGQALYEIVVQTPMRPLTGAFDGLIINFAVDDMIFGIPVQKFQDPYVMWPIAWGSLVLVAAAFWWIGVTRFGETLRGIRENEERMRFCGYNTYLPRYLAFLLSGAVASLAGVLFGLNAGLVTPDILTFKQGGDALVAGIVGGLATVFGPAVGAFLFVIAQLFFSESGNLHLMTGLSLILALTLFPGGIVGGVSALTDRGRRWIESRKDGQA